MHIPNTKRIRFRVRACICLIATAAALPLHAQWTHLAGFTHTTVRLIAHSGTVWFVGSEDAGLFRSTDGGSEWQLMQTGATGSVVDALLVFGDTVYVNAGTEEVFTSDDNGDHWYPNSNGLQGWSVQLFVHVRDSMYGLTGGQTTFRRGLGFGFWQWVQSYHPEAKYCHYSVDHGSTKFIGGKHGIILRSQDGGDTWSHVDKGLDGDTIKALSASSKNVFAGTALRLYRSSDDGDHWVDVSPMRPDYFFVDAFAATDSVCIVGSQDGQVYRSTDEGETWTRANAGLGGVGPLVLDGMGTTFFMGTHEGVFRSTDGGQSWTSSNVGLPQDSIVCLATMDSVLFAGTPSGVIRSFDKGEHWQTAYGSLQFNPLTFAVRDHYLFVGSTDGVFRTGDSGKTWAHLLHGASYYSACPSIGISGDTVVASLTGIGVWKSMDNGDHWAYMIAGLSDTMAIESLAVATFAVQHSTVFAGTNFGTYRAPLSAIGWASVGSQVPSTGAPLLGAVSGALYGGSEQGLYRSSDQGGHWTRVSQRVMTAPVVRAGSLAFAGTDEGPMYSEAGADRWRLCAQGFAPARVTGLATDGRVVYLATGGKGLWRRSIPELLSVDDKAVMPRLPVLAQNFPNPFSAYTDITFSMPSAGGARGVVVYVYDLYGRRVCSVDAGDADGAPRTVRVSAGTLHAGTYVYELRSGSRVVRRLCTVVK